MRGFWKLEKWPQCKGYSLCKMVSLGQKIKLPKTCEKRFYKHITDVLCKKRLQKTFHIREMRGYWKLEKMPTIEKWSVCVKKIKLPKTCEKRFYKHITDFLCKKRLQKTFHIREMRVLCKLENCPLCKGYNFIKMVSVGQRLLLCRFICLFRSLFVFLFCRRRQQ